MIANALPLGGVLFLGWEVFPLVLLFWMENVIVGFFSALKIAFAAPDDRHAGLAKLVMVPFFCVHYGMFCFVHGIFVLVLFGGKSRFGGPGLILETVRQSIHEWHLGWALAALVGSHAVSFVLNYLGKGENRRSSLERLMGAPYGRIVVLHVAILLGAFVILSVGAPTFGLVLLVLGKIAIDLKAHLREHGRLAEAASAPGTPTD
ncbi:MAG: hypothetical protein H7A45_19890 [Verrucomicrobiales bacterium]|nr:hypothetical protein [Verrucomicrobiales bacterium]